MAAACILFQSAWGIWLTIMASRQLKQNKLIGTGSRHTCSLLSRAALLLFKTNVKVIIILNYFLSYFSYTLKWKHSICSSFLF